MTYQRYILEFHSPLFLFSCLQKWCFVLCCFLVSFILFYFIFLFIYKPGGHQALVRAARHVEQLHEGRSAWGRRGEDGYSARCRASRRPCRRKDHAAADHNLEVEKKIIR